MDDNIRRRPFEKHNDRRVFCQPREKAYYIKAALYFSIVFLILLSFFAVNSAGESMDSEDQIVFQTVDPLIDASGEDSVISNSGIDIEFILSQELPLIHGVDIEEVYLDGSINSGGTKADIYFDVLPENIKQDILRFSADVPVEFYVNTKGPQILIYHTHTQEAYRQIVGEEYAETGSWRTADTTQSVVAVGDALTQELADYGFYVLHDTTNHEPPKLSTSYSRSLVTMEKYADKYSSIRMFIDIHRDAYGDIEAGSKDFVVVNGDECARVMFVVGTGEGKTSQGFAEKPNYESNYKLAQAITNQLESMKKGFTRPIRVKTGRYNQHVSDMCVLIEVGHNANALAQALNTTKYLALAISRVIDVE